MYQTPGSNRGRGKLFMDEEDMVPDSGEELIIQ